MPSDEITDAWVEPSILTNEEVLTKIGEILNVEAVEVKTWVIIAHIHPKELDHQTRAASNCPTGELVTKLIIEGLEVL